MKLRSPEAFWLLKNGILNSYPKLQKNTACDIVVLGAGVTGALISQALCNTGYDDGQARCGKWQFGCHHLYVAIRN